MHIMAQDCMIENDLYSNCATPPWKGQQAVLQLACIFLQLWLPGGVRADDRQIKQPGSRPSLPQPITDEVYIGSIQHSNETADPHSNDKRFNRQGGIYCLMR